MELLDTLKYINENSKYVSIDKDNMNRYLDTINTWDYHYWLKNETVTLTEQELIIFAFLCESMNFCFWKNRNWKIKFNHNYYGGSEALFYAILKEVKLNPKFLDINYLYNMRKKDFKKIMEYNGQLPPMFDKRFKLLKETIKIIYYKKDLFFTELFSIKTVQELLNYIVMNFKHFDDKSKFKRKTIHFNKRATLLINDLFHLSKTIKNNIQSIDSLTGGADYALPRLFEEYGILKYNKKLLDKILKGKSIKHNSRMEVEIRANTLYVLELMKQKLKEHYININSIELDNIIWNTRNKQIYKKPPHHTITIYY